VKGIYFANTSAQQRATATMKQNNHVGHLTRY